MNKIILSIFLSFALVTFPTNISSATVASNTLSHLKKELTLSVQRYHQEAVIDIGRANKDSTHATLYIDAASKMSALSSQANSLLKKLTIKNQKTISKEAIKMHKAAVLVNQSLMNINSK